MLKERVMFRLMLMMMIEGVWIKGVMTEVYNVGESDGWKIPVNSSYSNWASSKKFRVGDILWFHYDPASHNVVQVNRMGYRLCNISAPLKTYETGNDSFTIEGPGHYYFICSFPGHCRGGQKLDVRVLKKYSVTTTPHTTRTPPKPIGLTPESVANAIDPMSLFGRIVVVFIICVTMWVA
ncbi:hypothetical protein L1887_06006 [Cichorium endivia]|nr:hypothetical protein L1887_06006 [Cichorium endivia]